MAELISLIILLVTFSSGVVSERFYFDYSDCNSTCVKPYEYCLIYNPAINKFKIHCTALEYNCLSDHTHHVVCLRPNQPPLGGELIWLNFKKNHLQPKPAPLTTSFPSVAMIISLVSNILFLITIFVQVLQKCLKRKPHERLQDASNPSPNPSLDRVSISN